MKLKHVGLGLVAAAAAATSAIALPATTALALPPGISTPPTAPVSTLDMSQHSGTGLTQFSFIPGSGFTCPGSGTPDGYHLDTFLIPISANPADLVWIADSPTNPADLTGAYYTLYTAADLPITGFPVENNPTVVGGTEFAASYSAVNNLRFGALAGGVPSGTYQIGLACVAGGETARYWSTPIVYTDGATPAAQSFTYGLPTSAPTAAPVVTAGQSGTTQTVSASWTAPAANPAVTTFDVTLKQGPATIGAPQLGISGLSTSFTSVPYGTGYTVTVVAHNTVGPSPEGTSSSFALVAPAPFEGPIYQEVTVERPPGLIVMTQKCAAGTTAPTVATPVASGTNPSESPVNLPTTPDPKFGDYPYPAPANYPTYCSVQMNTATYISSDTRALAIGGATGFAGEYYEATGVIQPVTVVDARDVDAGWHVDVIVDPVFTGQGLGPTLSHDTFPGNNLGIKTTGIDDSEPIGAYDQTVVTGAAAGYAPLTGGLATAAKPLAKAAAGAGTGQATFGADLDVVIPVTVDQDTYAATLTFTLVTSQLP